MIRIIFTISLFIIILTFQINAQMFIEGGYTWSRAFGYQKDDTYPQYNINAQKLELISSSLNNDYVEKYFKIGIGYRFKYKNLTHSLSANYNRNGAGGDFAVDIFNDEFAFANIGTILINHIKPGGYTIYDTDYMFGFYNDNIGMRYALHVLKKSIFSLSFYAQYDISFGSWVKIISIQNFPNPITTESPTLQQRDDDKIKSTMNYRALSLGADIEIPINKYLVPYIGLQQSITNYTRRGEIFSNRTFVSILELGVRFYQ